jgi:micrococcal nuclease
LRSGMVVRFSRRRRRSIVSVEAYLIALIAAAIVGLLLQTGVGERTLRLSLPFAAKERAAASLAPLSPSRIAVVDGDTIRVSGEPRSIRLVGFNAPETFEPRCAAESALGNRARQRLRDLIGSGSVALAKVPCACQPGTEGTDRCNYGRSCGFLTVDGRDVGDVLIAENLAAPFLCGARSCPRTPRPWCG